MKRLKELYDYRDMVFSLVRRELRGRYQKSVLGMLWNFLNPLFQVAIYTIVFTVIMPNNMPNFYIYLSVGLIPWTFFSESLGQGAGTIVYNGDLTKKIYFPREVLTIASITAKFVNLLLSFIIIFIFLFISGMGVKPALLIWLVPNLIAEYMLALGLALIAASVTVYLRDCEYIVGVLLMAWIWGTPIMYTLDNVRPFLVFILRLNPVTNLVMTYHDVLYYQVSPSVPTVLVSLLVGFVVMIIGENVFLKLEADFAEEL